MLVNLQCEKLLVQLLEHNYLYELILSNNKTENKVFWTEVEVARLDVFISEAAKISRRKARALCDAGEISVNGKPHRSGWKVLAGSSIEILSDASPLIARAALAKKESFPIEPRIAHEDQHLLVVEKPRLSHCVVQKNSDPLTLADWLACHYPSTVNASPNPAEAGLLQRLDFYTSGLLVAAKDSNTWSKLREALFAGELRKSYLCLVIGELRKKKFEIDSPISLVRNEPRVFVGDQPLPNKTPETAVKIVETASDVELIKTLPVGFVCGDSASLVKVSGSRMTRHQVRAHLAAAGHPLVGDKLYGGSKANAVKNIPGISEGFLLHASGIEFSDSLFGVSVSSSPDWEKVL